MFCTVHVGCKSTDVLHLYIVECTSNVLHCTYGLELFCTLLVQYILHILCCTCILYIVHLLCCTVHACMYIVHILYCTVPWIVQLLYCRLNIYCNAEYCTGSKHVLYCTLHIVYACTVLYYTCILFVEYSCLECE